MSLEAIRRAYGVPAYRGKPVWFQGQPHVITGATRTGQHLRIRPVDGGRTVRVHPTWEMVYGEQRVDERIAAWHADDSPSSAGTPEPAAPTFEQLHAIHLLSCAADLPDVVYAVPDDTIGGWCVMPADVTPAVAPADMHAIASFVDEPTARLIAALLNSAPSLLHAAGYVDPLTMPRIDELAATAAAEPTAGDDR